MENPIKEFKFTKEDCILLLKNKYAVLQSEGLARYPKRSDFSDREVTAIKAFLGPWPRALEIASVKPPRNDGKEERRTAKRIQAKRKKTAAKIQKKKMEKASS